MKKFIAILFCISILFSTAYADNIENMGYGWKNGHWQGEFPSLKRAIQGAVMLYCPTDAWTFGGYNWVYVNYDNVEIEDTIKVNNVLYQYRHRSIYGINYVAPEDSDNKDSMRYSSPMGGGVFNIELKYENDNYVIINFEHVKEAYHDLNDNEYVWEDEERMARKNELGPYIKGFNYNSGQVAYEKSYTLDNNYPYFYNYIGMYVVDGKVFRAQYVNDKPSFRIDVFDEKTSEHLESWLLEPQDDVVRKKQLEIENG